MKQSIFTIISLENIAPNVYRMVLSGDTSAITASGQFVSVMGCEMWHYFVFKRTEMSSVGLVREGAFSKYAPITRCILTLGKRGEIAS